MGGDISETPLSVSDIFGQKEVLMMLGKQFSDRHNGPNADQTQAMLKELSINGLDQLLENAIPEVVRNISALDLPPALSEVAFLEKAKKIASKNKVYKNYIGLGYSPCITPSVIQRNILENPGWYTAYTPYQAEISQGRMEALLNFQTMVTSLTGMDMANASLLDEATAAAESISLAFSAQRKNKSTKIFISKNIYAQCKEVINTRLEPLGLEAVFGEVTPQIFNQDQYFAVLVQCPDTNGKVFNYSDVSQAAKENDCLVIAGADLLSLCLMQAPSEWGADIVYGSTQRFGVPLGFGGPHAAFLATTDKYKRLLPGRIIGVSKDRHGRQALRLSLQTREQHIRREKATSNICTSQVLLAVMASMYAVYHGPKGLKHIALKVHQLTHHLSQQLQKLGFSTANENYFDTIQLKMTKEEAESYLQAALAQDINLFHFGDGRLNISINETTTQNDLDAIIRIFSKENSSKNNFTFSEQTYFAKDLSRTTEYLEHPIFNSFHSETDMLRYIHRLEKKDLSLTHSMIPLGSCTMKLNATTEMLPVTWEDFSSLHPFAPTDQALGYMELIKEFEHWLCEITGFSAVSFQPNAGSQGEYAGLLVIRKYLQSLNQHHRNICLIPSSAHGTNPASAVMAGMKVVVVLCDDQGNIDVNDLKEKAKEHSDHLAALMVTYPSTHGVFESSIKEICQTIHSHGGQVYLDGANLNALVGVCQIEKIGADVAHMNLHKTFCIPHGGGGPGVGPIGVAEHLKNFIPTHEMNPDCGPTTGSSAVSAAPWGSASILPISWAYVAMMGEAGLKEATQLAILNANYIAKKLSPHYPILFTGKDGWVAHECILDVRPLKDLADISVDDIAKRLMDYNFHAPTMSWPVIGTLMIEPTESESLPELDRFCEAMIEIKKEAMEIAEKNLDKTNNVLKNAPHSIHTITADSWDYPYSRSQAAYPLPWVREKKFWTPVDRVDNVFGDKNLVCTCPPLTDYE